MAEATVGTTTNIGNGATSNATSDGSLRRNSLIGRRHLAVPLTVTSDGDVYTSGITTIQRVAWEQGANSPDTPEYATPYFATEALRKAGTVTFQTSGTVEGVLHLWC